MPTPKQEAEAAEEPVVEIDEQDTGNDLGIDEEIVDILEFDPFKAEDQKEPKSEETPPTEVAEDVQSETPPADDGGEPPIPAIPASGTTDDSPAVAPVADPVATTNEALAALQALSAAQTTEIARLREQQTPTAAPGADAAPAQPNYAFDVPDALIHAIGSDDPVEQKQGLSALMQGLGNAIHAQVMESVETKIGSISDQVSTGINADKEREDIKKDFYGAFPHLNNPAIGLMVAQTASDVMKETRATGWSPEIRDLIGQRIEATLLGIKAGQAPATPPPPGAPVALTPPVVLGTTTRPVGGAPTDKLTADIIQTLGFG